jgi:hypothetical protein
MKTLFINTQRGICLFVLGLIVLRQTALASDMTAFDLIKEGNRYIGEQSKDKVVQVRSAKSIGGMTPEIWHVVYHDPDATLKAVEIKFGAGRKMEVKRPVRLLELIGNADQILPRKKLKVDSDKALDIAAQEPLLAKLTLKASRLTLERFSADDETPVWRIRLWAAKLKNPNDDADIGQIVISAEDGKVLKSDLKPEHVD